MTDQGKTDAGNVSFQIFVQHDRPDTDGSWVGIQIGTTFNVYAISFPPDYADQLAEYLRKGLIDAASEARNYVRPDASGPKLYIPHN